MVRSTSFSLFASGTLCFRRVSTVCVFVIVGTATLRADGPFTELVIFGDSWTDAGNIFHDSEQFNPQPPYFDGRYSDGPVWPSHLADILGVTRPTASQLGGTNFAYGGAQTGSGSVVSWFRVPDSGPIDIPNVGSQIENYLATSPAIGSGQLYAIFGGFNDFNNGNARPQEVVDNVVDHVNALHVAGAENFLLFTLEFEDFREDYAEFNRLLKPTVESLKESIPGNFFLVDFKQLTGPVIDSFSNHAIVSQFGSAMNDNREVVSNPGQYFWWDPGFHPTTRYHRILASKIAEVLVPDLDTHYVGGWQKIAREEHATPVNLALAGTATQSSSRGSSDRFEAFNANDGKINGPRAETNRTESEHWWQLSLDDPRQLTEVRIFSSSEPTIVGGGGFRVELLDADAEVVWHEDITDEPFDYPIAVEIESADQAVIAESLRLSKLAPILERQGNFSLVEVEIFGDIVSPSDLNLKDRNSLHFEIDGDPAARIVCPGLAHNVCHQQGWLTTVNAHEKGPPKRSLEGADLM